MKRAIMGALALLASTSAHAVEIYSYDDMPTTLSIEGEFKLGDDDILLDVLANRKAEGKTTEYVMLASPGGILLPAWKMSQTFQLLGIKTFVMEKDECASACMLAFAGGAERHIWAGAKLGVHNASMGGTGGDADDPSYDTTLRWATDMKNYGAPPAVIAKLVTTPPDSMSYLTEEDIAGWVTVHREETAYVAPEKPQVAPSSGSMSMTCRSTKSGGLYVVYWDRSNRLQVGDNIYFVGDWHNNSSTGALVVNGTTHINTLYAAVFGGPNPRMGFSDGKEKAIDHCWL